MLSIYKKTPLHGAQLRIMLMTVLWRESAIVCDSNLMFTFCATVYSGMWGFVPRIIFNIISRNTCVVEIIAILIPGQYKRPSYRRFCGNRRSHTDIFMCQDIKPYLGVASLHRAMQGYSLGLIEHREGMVRCTGRYDE